MQVLFEYGVEHGIETDGFRQWPGTVERLKAPVLPHMGWNTVSVPPARALFAGVDDERFYFVHSYAARRWELTGIGPLRAARGHLVRARRALRRGRRERPAVGDAVPPGEVRRRRAALLATGSARCGRAEAAVAKERAARRAAREAEAEAERARRARARAKRERRAERAARARGLVPRPVRTARPQGLLEQRRRRRLWSMGGLVVLVQVLTWPFVGSWWGRAVVLVLSLFLLAVVWTLVYDRR